MYRGLRAIVAFALYVRTTSRCVRLRQQLWPLMTGNGCATYTPPNTHTTRKLFSSWGNIETYNHNLIIFQISIGLSILQQRPIGTDRPNFLAKNVKSHRPVKNDIPENHDFKLEGVTIKWDRPINVEMIRKYVFGCCSVLCLLSWTLSGGSNLMIWVPELTFFTV